MIKYFLAFILLASPCFAGIGIGGFPYPGPGYGQNSELVWIVDDNFTDTSTTRWPVVGEGVLIISGGVAYQSGTGQTVFESSTDLGSSSQVVQGLVTEQGSGSSAFSGLFVRGNGTTGHRCAPISANSTITCYATGGIGTNAVSSVLSGGTWADGDRRVLRVTTNSSNVYNFYVDWNGDGDPSNDSGPHATVTNSSYSGTHVGITFNYSNSTGYVDNFKAGINQ